MGTRRIDGVDADEIDRQLAHLRQALQDFLPTEMPHIQVDALPVRSDPPAFIDLGLLRAADQIPGGQFHLVGRIFLHEAVAILVGEIAALAATGLAHENAVFVEARGMELHEFHVHQRHAGIVGDGHAVAGVGEGVGGDLERPTIAAGAEQHRLGPHGVDFAGEHVHRHHAPADVVFDDQIHAYHSL